MSPIFDQLTKHLEANGYGWDIGHAGRLREARVWEWPFCVGRYRPNRWEPAEDTLLEAMLNADMEVTFDKNHEVVLSIKFPPRKHPSADQ